MRSFPTFKMAGVASERVRPGRRLSRQGCLLAVATGVFSFAVSAQAGDDTKELAKKSQNPVSTLISVPFENNINFNSGPGNNTDDVLNIKPVIPVGITEDWNLINRVILPVVSQGSRMPGQDRKSGLGDTSFQVFLSPAEPGKLIWGAGPILVAPTGTDSRLTADKWSLGPSVVLLAMPGQWVVGGLVSNFWSFAGDDSDPEVSFLSAQYFVNYNMEGGWYLSSAPTITANWKATDSNTWTIPFGAGLGRVFKIGSQAVNAKVAAYYNVERPRFASDWTLQFTVILLFPK